MLSFRELFSAKEVEALRPGERFAYDNCEFFEVKEFLGGGKWAEPMKCETIELACTVAAGVKARRGRPLVYAVAHRNGEKCVCFVPTREVL